MRKGCSARTATHSSNPSNGRNAIYALKNKSIDDGFELEDAVRGHLALLRKVNARLAYHDDTMRRVSDRKLQQQNNLRCLGEL